MDDIWTVRRLLEWMIPYFENLGLERARFDSEMLLASSLGKDRLWLYTHYDQPLMRQELDKFRSVVLRRSRREPLQYILGQWGFWSLDFAVSPGVLIPRQETEHLVECTLKFAGSIDNVLDLCTGSGNIVISLAKELPAASFWATDISNEAIKIAKDNAKAHGLLERISFLEGDLFDPLRSQECHFDLIVCNPPYIPTGQIDALQPEIKDFEPRIAVDGGKDGLNFYRRLVPEAIPFLKSSGYLIMEIGVNQANAVQDMMKHLDYRDIAVFKDYAYQDRVLVGKCPISDKRPAGMEETMKSKSSNDHQMDPFGKER